MKLTFQSKKTYYFISVVVLLISLVVVPFTQNIINQKKINSYSAISDFFEKPLLLNNDTISLNDFKGKVLVLDFWNSACGSCFKKFPDFEKLTSKYKLNKEILFFAVNTPLKREKAKNPQKIMDSLNYNFENLFLFDDSIALGLGIKFYPTVLYIDKTQTKIISGNIETNFWIYNNSYNIIDKLSKE
ncbi:MAG: TlpA family protein disulfide reductase [Deltaproteobacteria bacterium]